VAKIPNRWIFSALWVEGDDCSDGADIDILTPNDKAPTDGCYIALQHADNGSIWQRVEEGKQYSYYVEPAAGWKIHSVTFNGAELTPDADNFVQTPAVAVQYNRLIVTFEQETTAIQGVPAATPSNVKILGSAEGIHITNATPGDQVTVCTLDGRTVYSRRMTGHQADVALKSNTLYIIKVADKVVKVRL